jgi:hypothetical protein
VTPMIDCWQFWAGYFFGILVANLARSFFAYLTKPPERKDE